MTRCLLQVVVEEHGNEGGWAQSQRGNLEQGKRGKVITPSPLSEFSCSQHMHKLNKGREGKDMGLDGK